ncbi:DNA polymerase delta subunit 3 [Glycine soja]|nr:DNA polymerase delta subunit 3 [Glycine soja]
MDSFAMVLIPKPEARSHRCSSRRRSPITSKATISYKWLSRNYMVSSDEAKRLLQEFVQKHEGGLEVVYALSGWLKSNHPSYHVRLVTGPKLEEAQQEFDGDCSVQIYSVQASIPKDPAVLWNAEFIQAEELFKQPSSVDNCLRDNRFSGVFNSFVRWNVDGPTVVSAAPQSKSLGEGPTKSNIVHQPSKNIACDSIDKVDTKPQSVVKEVKSESNGIGNTVVHDNINTPTADKEKAPPLPTGQKKVQADKSGSVNGGSLASLWGRASAKPRPCSSSAENNNKISNPPDEDEDEDDVVSLASPDFPNKQSSLDSTPNDKKTSEKTTLNFDSQEENKSTVKEERATDQKARLPLRENVSAISKCTNTGKSSSEKLQSGAPEVHLSKHSVNNPPPCSPKRRKVMKTRIDERGREVTEVVWEGEETEEKKPDKVTTKKSDSNASTKAIDSAPATKKPPANSNAISGKGGKKKAGNSKDPKQGNILSFFKRV